MEDVALVRNGKTDGDEYGASVAGAGDFDADGVTDLVIGAPGNGGGRAEVYFGLRQTGLSGTAPTVITGEFSGDRLGEAVSGFLPFQRGQAVELLLGAPSNAVLGSETGAIYGVTKAVAVDDAIRAATIGAAFVDYSAPDPAAASGGPARFGALIRAGLDVNGDKKGDVLIGLPGAALTGKAAGAVFVAW
jgi:hypothetical protein